MNLQFGKMYLVKQYFWCLFPTKELAWVRASGMERAWASREAKYFSEHYKCNVSVFEENTYVVLLEQDNDYIKILDSNGNIGWIWCTEFSGYFELVKE